MSLQVIINLYQTSLNKRSSCLLVLIESVKFKSFRLNSIKVLPELHYYCLTIPAILWMPVSSSTWCLQITKHLPVANWSTSFLKNFQGVWGEKVKFHNHQMCFWVSWWLSTTEACWPSLYEECHTLIGIDFHCPYHRSDEIT